MSSCVVIQCSICDETVHHGQCMPCGTHPLIPFVIGNTHHYVCEKCESAPMQRLLNKYKRESDAAGCFFCDLCSTHSDEVRTYVRWGSWGKDVCSTCTPKTSFKQFTEGCKCV